MRKIFVLLFLLTTILTSCNRSGVKFAPKERQSTLSIAERDSAIAQKKRETNFDPDVMLFQNNIKLAVAGPAPQGEITEQVTMKVMTRLMQIASKNGIAATGDSPCFAIACQFNPISKEATGTAPQKMICNYDAVIFVGNLITGDIYACTTQRVSGVGSTFTEAAIIASNEIEDSKEMQQMLSDAESTIISWYESNVQVFAQDVEALVSQGDLEKAFAMLRSVPKEATNCFKYSSSRLKDVEKKLLTKHANEQLHEMENAIAQAGDKYSPTVSASFKLIPENTPAYAKAEKMWQSYTTQIANARRDSIEWEKHKYNEELETERLKMKYSYEASMRAQKNAADGKVSSQPWKMPEKKGGLFKDEYGNIKWKNVAWTAAAVGVGGVALAGASALGLANTVLSRSLFLFIR